MSKAIITIEDQDDRIEVTVTFDPPLAKKGNASSAQWLAAKMIERSTELCERIDLEGGAA
jgi:hypothetical protein